MRLCREKTSTTRSVRRPRSERPAPLNQAGLASDNLAYTLRTTPAADAPEEIAEISHGRGRFAAAFVRGARRRQPGEHP
jgi:hypothetical protein